VAQDRVLRQWIEGERSVIERDKRAANRATLYKRLTLVGLGGDKLFVMEKTLTEYLLCESCDCSITNKLCHICGAGQVFKEMSKRRAERDKAGYK
jgi:hypothetical protein